MSGQKIIDGLTDVLAGRVSVRLGYSFVCALPGGLGMVTKLRRQGARVIAETASGVDFIVPARKPEQGDGR